MSRLIALAVPAAAMAMMPARALAHAGAAGQETAWTAATALLLVALAVAYILGFGRFVRAGRGPATPLAAIWFAAGMATTALAVVGPLDRLADALFAGHMVQHLTLMLVAAPLLVAGRTGLMLFRALPSRLRRSVGRFGSSGSVAVLAHPVAVWVWFSAVFAFWHLPVPYWLALVSPPVHALEHATLLGVSCAFWGVVMGRTGRRSIGHLAAAFYVASAAAVSSLPGALMILANRPLYDGHQDGQAAWGLTALEDQQLGGLVMWVPGSLVYLGAVVCLLLLGLRGAGPPRRPSSRLAPLVAIGALAILGACREDGRQAAASRIGDVEAGRDLIVARGCAACHIVPGVPAAQGLAGPPLDHMARRIYLAGLLRNTPDNMVTWLMEPQEVSPGNAMPDLGLSRDEARDITAYLYTLD